MSYQKQLDILTTMQNQGFNVCDCGNCGGVILFDEESKNADEVECPHCKVTLDYSDCPDLYYEGMPELDKERDSTDAQ
jgi:DNA-directed RNA polymerase subunit RPC12/RpoP